MMKRNRNGGSRRTLRVVLTVLVLCVLLTGALTLFLVTNRERELDRLEQYREDWLQELTENRGEYDEQSIVLADTSSGVAKALANRLGAKLRITKDGSFATLTLPEGMTILDVCVCEDYLSDLPQMSADYQVQVSELTEEEPDDLPLPMRPQYDVTDTAYEMQTYLDYMNLKSIWSLTRGNGITVAVIDTGIDTDHPEFAGRISEYSYNASEDKVVKNYTVNGEYDWSLIEDTDGHGTSVAGVLAGAMDGNGIVGVAPEVEILVIKAELDENGRFKRTSDLVFGIYYAIERDVDVVNMSFGGKGDESSNPYAKVTQLARDSDVICLAAAGNESTAGTVYPAADPNVFGVGALAANSWELATYSNYGENVDFVAPGTTYTATMGGGYGTINGTSFACPNAAGAIALYLSVNRYQEFLTVEEILYASCVDLGDLGPDWYFGYGALDIFALISEERGTVTFNMMTDELENTQQLFIRDHTLQNMPEPERLYAVFDGWYYDPHCTEEYNWYADAFSSDLTLYANWVNEEDGIPFTYVELDDGTIEIRSYTGHRRFITIPDTIEGKTVSSIGERAFAGDTRIRQITLPSSLVYIRQSAFDGCSALVSISIPDTVLEIGHYAFNGNIRLSSVSFGSNSQLTAIGNSAFAGCVKLRGFTLPKRLSSLNGTAFIGDTSMVAFGVQSGNTAFTVIDGVLLDNTRKLLVAYPAGKSGNYTLPTSVTEIGTAAFAYTRITEIGLGSVNSIGAQAFIFSSLTSLTLPDSVSSMGSQTFSSSEKLKTVVLGSGLASIPQGAFMNCPYLKSITVPAGIKTIEMSAFADATSLTDLIFTADSTLTAIKAKAFQCCAITDLTLPASLKSIDAEAFTSCPLTTVTFAENSALQEIGKYAFANILTLKEITLPDSLLSLGDFAFSNTGLTSLTLPASLTSVASGAFASCNDLTEILVSNGNTAYVSVNGVLFDKAKTTLHTYPAGKAELSYTIPDGVSAIGDNAFWGTSRLQELIMPDSVTAVGEYAFYSCIGMRNYRISENLTAIKCYAFACNPALPSLSVPDNVVQISNYAFAEDWSLASISFNDTSKLPRISYAAFANCGLTSFRVPANVSQIAQGVFEGCTQLTEITFAANSQLTSISAYLFNGCQSLTSIVFEPGSALTSIQAHGFEGMRNLTNLDLGNAKLTNIDNFAFRFCEKLTALQVPEGVTYIGRYAFYNCLSLKQLTIPESVEYIGRFAFLGAESLNVYFAANTLPAYLQQDWDYGIMGYYLGVKNLTTDENFTYASLEGGKVALIQYLGNATSLDLNEFDLGGEIITVGGNAFAYSVAQEVILPDTLVNILAEAFYNSHIKSITVPASVEFIGREAFADTPIEVLTFESDSRLTVIEQSAFENTTSLGSVTIPASVTTLGRAVFKNSGISALTFSDGIALTEIPEDAFAYSAITSLRIPDSVTLINHNAFRETAALTDVEFGTGENLMLMSNAFYHSGLTSVTIPDNLTYIGEYAFVALPNLQAFTVSEENDYYRTTDGLLLSKDGRKLIAVPAGREGSLTVPQGVEIIGFGAFENTKLSEILFRSDANILSLGYRSFYGAENLTEIHIPASVVAIDYYAFANCSSLTRVTFAEGSGLNGIYEGAFYGCEKLSDIILPDSIIEISDFAFYGCASLTQLPIGENSSLMGIYSYAMAYTGLSGDLSTPAGLIDIGEYAFMGTAITSVTVPSDNAWNLIIGLGAFRDCNKLTEMTLPFIGASFEDNNLTWFGYIFGAGGQEANAVYVPESLKTVTVSEGLTEIGRYAFYQLGNLEQINLPHSIVTLGRYAFCETSAIYELTNEISLETNRIDLFNQYFGWGQVGELHLAEGLEHIEHSLGGNVTRLYLPSTLNYISDGLLAYEQTMVSVEISEENPYFSSYDGILYNKDRTEIVAVPGGITGRLVLPETLKEIPEHAFVDCHNLTELVLSEGITTIRDSAFYGCFNLTKVTLPSTLTLIEDEAFRICSSLLVIQNNSTLTLNFGSESNGYVSYYAKTVIGKDGTLQYLDSNSGTEYIQTADGFHFMKTADSYTLFAYLGDEDTVTLPETVNGQRYSIYHMRGVRVLTIPGSVEIGSYAFQDNQTLEHVTILDGVTSIGYGAFDCCYNLISVTMPDSVTELAGGAFSTSGLQRIRLSNNLTSIESGTFHFCGALTEIELPEKLTSIGYEAFRYSGLESIRIPAGVTDISPNAFEYCNKLINFEIDSANSSYLEQDGIIYNRTGTEMVFVLPTVSGHVELSGTLESIPDSAFYDMSAITSVTVPDTVTYIGGRAFGNTSLTEITLPKGLTYLGADAICCSDLQKVYFKGDLQDWLNIQQGYNNSTHSYDLYFNGEKVTSITIPEGVTELKSYAFVNTNIEQITLPESLSSIGSETFGDCYLLQRIHIPASVQSIDASAFNNCKSLKKITVAENNPNYSSYDGALYNKSCTELLIIPAGLVGHLDICEGVTVIERFLISNSIFSSITIPSTVTEIGEWAFVGNSIEVIYNNSSLNLTLRDDSNGMVARNAKLIVDRNGGKTYLDGFSDLELFEQDSFVFVRKQGQLYIIAYTGEQSTVTIPRSVNGEACIPSMLVGIKNAVFPDGTTVIPEAAFRNSESLCSVVIPDGVTEIGTHAFSGCTSLTEINIPDTVTSIHSSILSGTAYERNPDNWDGNALYVGNHLIEISKDTEYFAVREGTRSVSQSAFSQCYMLKKLTFPARLCSQNLLYALTNLETLVLTGSVYQPIESVLGQIPLTLKAIVLTDNPVFMTTEATQIFDGITGITIYVGAAEKDLRWNENFPGWNNQNAVLYGDRWISADFYDANGELISSDIFSTAAVIRRPWVGDYTENGFYYAFTGFDLDGDGTVDPLPATSTVSISAHAVYSLELRCETEGHRYVLNPESLGTDSHRLYCACGESTTEAHTWSAFGTIKKPATHMEEGEMEVSCTLCSEVGLASIPKLAEHCFDQWITEDRYLISEATCLTQAHYYYSCLCGERGNGDSFYSGELAEHQHDGEWYYNTDMHWHVCTVCGVEFDLSSHTLDSRDNIMYCDTCPFDQENNTGKLPNDNPVDNPDDPTDNTDDEWNVNNGDVTVDGLETNRADMIPNNKPSSSTASGCASSASASGAAILVLITLLGTAILCSTKKRKA